MRATFGENGSLALGEADKGERARRWSSSLALSVSSRIRRIIAPWSLIYPTESAEAVLPADLVMECIGRRRSTRSSCHFCWEIKDLRRKPLS
jgi:hypothetical protein